MLYRVMLMEPVVQAVSTMHPETKKQIKTVLKELSKNLYTGKSLQDELTGFRSCKMKRYRIIYTTDEQHRQIRVFMIGHRKDVYSLLSDIVQIR